VAAPTQAVWALLADASRWAQWYAACQLAGRPRFNSAHHASRHAHQPGLRAGTDSEEHVMIFKQRTIFDIPAEQLDVTRWLFRMSDSDYQATASGHRALGTSVEAGTQHMVNVESIGGNLPCQQKTSERSPLLGGRNRDAVALPRRCVRS
jgi:hypothetical protein